MILGGKIENEKKDLSDNSLDMMFKFIEIH